MKNYYRLMLGKKSVFAEQCFAGNYMGADLSINQDLTGKLPEEWRAFNKEFIPAFLEVHPEKSKVSAGLICGFLWTLAKGIQKGDIVLCPDGSRSYRVAEVTGDYYHRHGETPWHRRPVRWLSKTIDRDQMSEGLRNSTGSAGTVCEITRHHQEIEELIEGETPAEEIEDAAAFAMEKHLEDFLVRNWAQTPLSKEYEIYEEDGEPVGQQYATDTGPIDILAISRDRKTLLVIELKRERASDNVVGQTLRYMGYVKDELAEEGQTVKGMIIAGEDDLRTKRALSMPLNIEFFRYQVNFKLVKA